MISSIEYYRIAEIPAVVNRIRKAITEEISEKEKVKIEDIKSDKEDEVKSSALQQEIEALKVEFLSHCFHFKSNDSLSNLMQI